MNYCNALWHGGGDQPVVLLRRNKAQIAVMAAVNVSHLSLENLHILYGIKGQARLLANQV